MHAYDSTNAFAYLKYSTPHDDCFSQPASHDNYSLTASTEGVFFSINLVFCVLTNVCNFANL